jgi:hypothetical protein
MAGGECPLLQRLWRHGCDGSVAIEHCCGMALSRQTGCRRRLQSLDGHCTKQAFSLPEQAIRQRLKARCPVHVGPQHRARQPAQQQHQAALDDAAHVRL